MFLGNSSTNEIAPVIILTQRCFYCSRYFDPREMLTIGESVKMCQQCHQRHGLKIEAFNPPDICVGCNASRAEIEARELGGKFSMFAHWRDGEYQLLCRECDAKYVQQRADLYADTRFGWERKVK